MYSAGWCGRWTWRQCSGGLVEDDGGKMGEFLGAESTMSSPSAPLPRRSLSGTRVLSSQESFEGASGVI